MMRVLMITNLDVIFPAESYAISIFIYKVH